MNHKTWNTKYVINKIRSSNRRVLALIRSPVCACIVIVKGLVGYDFDLIKLDYWWLGVWWINKLFSSLVKFTVRLLYSKCAQIDVKKSMWFMIFQWFRSSYFLVSDLPSDVTLSGLCSGTMPSFMESSFFECSLHLALVIPSAHKLKKIMKDDLTLC